MKTVFFLCLVFSLSATAQNAVTKIYDPQANAKADLANVIKQATKEKKNIFVMAGGNWCSWCLEFNRFTKADPKIDSLFKADYLIYHLNYSPENKNDAVFASLGYPQRFGFPSFIILDEKGNRIHTQNSEYLEQGRSYNQKKVVEFLNQWNRAAYSPTASNAK